MKRQEYYEKRSQVATYYKLKALHKTLKLAWGTDVLIKNISDKWVNKYIEWKLTKGAAVNSIKKDLSTLAGLYKSASDNKNYFAIAQRAIKSQDVNREKLTLEDIINIENLELTGMEELARDMYLFSYYTHGMRFQNVAMFEESMIKKGLIHYRMNKSDKLREIEIHKKLSAIISKYKGGKPYLFPLLKIKITDDWQLKTEVGNANAMINARLKRVAIIAGIETKMHFHQTRHTFARLSLDRGVSLEILKDSLGHANYSTTQRYAKSLSDKRINDAVKGLYD